MKHARKTSVILASLLIIAAGVVTALELTNTTHLFRESNTKESSDNNGVPGPINYGPPTDVEKQDSESHKNDTTDDNSATPPDSNLDKKQVAVSITTWVQKDGNIEVNGFVSGIVEDSGTCTLTLTSSATGKKVSSSRTAVANATNTSCGASTISVNKLSIGEWRAVLSYSSSAAVGKSDAAQIEVH